MLLRSSGVFAFATLAIITLLCKQTVGATLHVPSDIPTIQGAIDASANGDIVLIAPGTYYENVNFKGRAITVTSEQGPQVTIIDGRYLAPVVSFTSAER